MNWAVSNGIVSGYGNGLFGPEDNITRQDLSVILYRYAEYAGIIAKGAPPVPYPLPYSDTHAISEYAIKAVTWTSANKITAGKPNNMFDPQGVATQAEVSAMLHRFLDYVSAAKPTDPIPSNTGAPENTLFKAYYQVVLELFDMDAGLRACLISP